MNESAMSLLVALARTTLLLAAAAVVVRAILGVTRCASPRAHRAAWALVLLQGWLFLRLTVAIPYDEMPPRPSHRITESAGGEQAHGEERAHGALPVVPSAPMRIVPEPESAVLSADVSPVDSARSSATEVPRSPSPVWRAWATSAGRNWPVLLVGVWLAGMGALVARAVVRYVLFLRRLPSARPAEDAWVRQWEELLADEGIRRRVRLRMTARVGPVLCRLPSGWQLLLPVDLWRGLTPAGRLAVLRHELAHLKRGDAWKSLLARLLALPHWFNPAAWWAVRKFEEAAEWACDGAATGADRRQAVEYARTLVHLGAPLTQHLACGPAARGHGLSIRVRRLLSPGTVEDSIMKRLLVIAIAFGLVAVCLLRFDLVAKEPTASVEPAGALAGAPAEEDPPKEAAGGKIPDATPEGESPVTVTGTVWGPGQKPVPDARVWLRQGSRSEKEYFSTSTDEQGRFQFREVAPGWTGVFVVAKGYSYASTSLALQSAQIATNVSLTVARPEPLILDLVDDEGQPVEGAELEHLGWKSPEGVKSWLLPEVLRREGMAIPASNKDGRLRIDGVPHGAVCKGRVKHPQFARRPFEHLTPGAQPHRLVLERGYPITVRAINRKTDERVADATVTVTGFPSSIGIYDEPVDENGELLVRLGSARHIFVRVRHPELIWPESYRIDAWGDFPSDLTIDAKLIRKATVTGRVVDEQTGEPVAGVGVGVAAYGPRRFVVSQRTTDESGRYEITGPEGYVSLQVLGGNGYWAPREHRVSAELDPAAPVAAPDLVARKLPTIRGTVVLPDGRPAASTLVRIRDFRTTPVVTDADGRFQLPMRRKAHSPRIEARHVKERLSGAGTLLFEDAEAGKTCEIQLAPDAAATGTVLDQDGRPREGVFVRLCAWGTTVDTAITDENGRYHFNGLIRGSTYHVVLTRNMLDMTLPRSNPIELTQDLATFDPLTLPDDLPAASASDEAADGLVGKPAPAWQCRAWINSPPLDLASLRGKYVLLDFWATWCGPCIAELPQVQAAHEWFAGKGVVVIGIHHDSVPLDEVQAFVQERHLTFPIGLDSEAGHTSGRYNVTSWPTEILIGPDGRVIADSFLGGHNFLWKLREVALSSQDD